MCGMVCMCGLIYKRFIKENNQLFTLTVVKELTYGGFNQVGPDNWKKLVEHVLRKINIGTMMVCKKSI